MSEHDGYIYQGRQQHGWFGHGTKPHELGSSGGASGIPAPEMFEEKLDAIIYGMIGAVPKRERAMVETRMDATARGHLRGAMLAWAGAEHLDRAKFRARFLPSAGDATVDLLRLATAAAKQARTFADPREGSELLAAAVGEVGVYGLPGFVAGAGQRAAAGAVLPVSDRRPVQPAPVPAGASPFTPDGSTPDLTPVPFLDDKGRIVNTTAANGNAIAIERPAGVDPHFFTNDGGKFDASIGYGLGKVVAELQNFRQGGPWDIQRLGGRNRPEFVNYSTVVIGLYGAASGIPEGVMLTLEDRYAKWYSHFDEKEPKDRTYTHLLETNVLNTRLGYELFRSGRIRRNSSQ